MTPPLNWAAGAAASQAKRRSEALEAAEVARTRADEADSRSRAAFQEAESARTGFADEARALAELLEPAEDDGRPPLIDAVAQPCHQATRVAIVEFALQPVEAVSYGAQQTFAQVDDALQQDAVFLGDQLRRGGGRGGGHVGDKVGDAVVDLVPDGGHHGHRGREDGARHGLVVKGPQVFG